MLALVLKQQELFQELQGAGLVWYQEQGLVVVVGWWYIVPVVVVEVALFHKDQGMVQDTVGEVHPL